MKTVVLFEQGGIQFEEAPLIVIGLFEGQTELEGSLAAVDRALSGGIQDVIEAGDFSGKKKEMALLYSRGNLPARRVLVVGLGKAEEFGLDEMREVAAAVARRARSLNINRYSTVVHGAHGRLDLAAASQALVEGALLGLYRFRELKSSDGDNEREIESLTVVEFEEENRADVEEGIRIGQIMAEATCYARDLSNRPGNIATPTYLAERAQELAGEVGLQCQVLGTQEIENHKMGGLLAVGKGSQEPPCFIVLEHGSSGEGQRTVVLVGKGVTFDSGGLSLKSASGMGDMKHDMSGAATVLGTMQAVARLNLPLHVVGLIPAVENMPDGRAYRPGDVLTMMSGTTVEIVSTDAEGRLILADALTYAARYKPAAIIDLATLTGGVVTALGNTVSGLMGNDERLAARVKAAAQATGEKVWELPLWEEDYADLIKSEVADIKNSGGRPASAITGGMFLKRFVQGFPWVHLDIAGTAYTDKVGDYTVKGATGVGVRMLTRLLQDWRTPRESAGT